MALQSSGSISFSNIRTEFGEPPNNNLGAYRITDTVGELTLPLDGGIPTSGTIRFSDFYGKKLNVIVFLSGNRVNARSNYNSNSGVRVVGEYKIRPSSVSGIKVWIHTNGDIGSNANTDNPPSTTYCSLLTGSWGSDTELILDIGSNARVLGSGGNGGKGGNATTAGQSAGGNVNITSGRNGKNGTSAIGVQHVPIVLNNRGIIRSGAGGGGGGGAGFGKDRDSNVFNETRGLQTTGRSGSGGGGGRGFPAGQGGAPGDIGPDLGDGEYFTRVTSGKSGSSGSKTSGGNGGNAVGSMSDERSAVGGAGGGGVNEGRGGSGISGASESSGTNATSSQGGSGGKGNFRSGDEGGGSRTGGGSGGANGYSIIVVGSSTQVRLRNTKEITGGIIYNTSPS